MLEAPTTLDQCVHVVSGNFGNPQVTLTGVYYPLGWQPTYPPPEGKPVVGSYPIVGGQPFTGNYGQIPNFV